MIEQIKQAIADAEMFGPSLTHHEWIKYLIDEVERLSECQSCGGRGYVELSHDPYMTSPCECVVFEQVVEDYPKLKQRNMEQKELIDRIQKQIMWGDANQTAWKIQKWIQEFQKEGE